MFEPSIMANPEELKAELDKAYAKIQKQEDEIYWLEEKNCNNETKIESLEKSVVMYRDDLDEVVKENEVLVKKNSELEENLQSARDQNLLYRVTSAIKHGP